MAKLEMTLCIHWNNQVDSLYSTDADISSQADISAQAIKLKGL